MTEQEWKKRCIERIHRVVKKTGRISLRDLKRATHYNRGSDYAIAIWHEALDSLEEKHLVTLEKERNEWGVDVVRFITLPTFALARAEAAKLGFSL
ncbi:hypothetical protein JAO29_03895 [Edaphobacter sp. HDX4]|uniref:hypothetical protein n=1 Tax=Edaphobacter sp. HDX4 TaxID=2794064 RepID=UPI002FE5385C